jgi:hypothetical protein
LNLQLTGDINETIRKRRTELIQIKGTLQPTPVFVGPSLEQIDSAYVVVNEALYNCSSSVDAVEFAFKSFFALNTEYPDECRQIWMFIQYYFCGIKIVGDNCSVNFKNIIKKLTDQ